MAIELTNAERETHLSLIADNRGVWAVYSDDPVMMRKLEGIGARVVKVEYGGGKHYELAANQVTLRKPPKPMSDARKTQLAARLAAMRAEQDAISK